MTVLALSTFGEPSARLPDNTALRFPTEKSLELLLLAAVAPGQELTRSEAAFALRSEHSEGLGRKALSTDLWRLRSVFDNAGLPSTDILETSGRSIALRQDAPIFVDALFLEQVWADLRNTPPGEISELDAGRMRRAIALYHGDFAKSLDQEWCFLYREKLRSKHMALMTLLMDHEAAKDNWQAGLRWADRLLELDPLLEHAHRTAMKCHFLMGNRASAIRQFSACRDILEQELSVPPSDETERMYRGLIHVTVDDPARPVKDRVTQSLSLSPAPVPKGQVRSERPITDQLSMALGSLDAARSLVANVDRRLRHPSS